MKKKIIGIFVIMLLITTAILPVTGTMKINNTEINNKLLTQSILQQNLLTGVKNTIHFKGLEVKDKDTNDNKFSIQQNFFVIMGDGTIAWCQNVYEVRYEGDPCQPNQKIFVKQLFNIYWVTEPGHELTGTAEYFQNGKEVQIQYCKEYELNSYINKDTDGKEYLWMSGLLATQGGKDSRAICVNGKDKARIVNTDDDANVRKTGKNVKMPNGKIVDLWQSCKTCPELDFVGFKSGDHAIFTPCTTGDIKAYVLNNGKWTSVKNTKIVPMDKQQPNETSEGLEFDKKGNFKHNKDKKDQGVSYNYTTVEWKKEVVDDIGNVGLYSSLVVDKKGWQHCSYYDKTNGDLKYAVWNGKYWNIEIVDSTGDVGLYTSLALDTLGNPHISYYDNTNHDLKYATLFGESWIVNTIDSEGDVGWSTSIALDSKNSPHISYYDLLNNKLKYATLDVEGWNILIRDDGGLYNSLDLTSDDRPFIAYTGSENGVMFTWYCEEHGWDSMLVDTGVEGYDISLAVYDGMWPAISYYGNGYLKYADGYGGEFTVKNIDYVTYGGWLSSISIHGVNPFVSYYDYLNKDLKCAYWNDLESLWIIETLDSIGDVGQHSSMCLKEGRVHITYYDVTNGNLKKFIEGCPPDKPDKPSGQSYGKTGNTYLYFSSTSDVDGDQVFYLWDWGDGTFSNWLGPYNFGETISTSYSWSDQGSYNIRVKAKDIDGFEGEWSNPLAVTMPRNKAINTPFLNWLQNHLNMFPMLSLLLQRLGLQ